MIDFEKIKYLSAALSNLNQTGHTDECLVDGIGDGRPCFCGFYDAVRGIEKLMAYYTGVN